MFSVGILRHHKLVARLLSQGCGGATVGLNEKFQAPPRRDEAAWRVVRFLVDNGFRFDSIWENSQRVWGAYPTTMDEAREFVVRYRHERRTSDD